MRPSTITLTYDHYGHLFEGQEADAVARLADVMSPPVAAAATGTDGENIYPHGPDTVRDQRIDGNQTSHAHTREVGALQQAQQSGRETVRSQCETVQHGGGESTNIPFPKPLSAANLGDDVRDDAKHSESTPGRIRTCDLRIRSPLLYPAELRAPKRPRLIYHIHVRPTGCQPKQNRRTHLRSPGTIWQQCC